MSLPLPPGTYFISHSYRDSSARDVLLGVLPQHVRPFIFPPISVSPIEFVSNALIGSILTCDAVMVIDGGYSAQSFWVAFERDYALRIGKPVFIFDPTHREINHYLTDRQNTLNLPVYPHGMGHYGDPVMDNMRTILDFMEHQRFFTFSADPLTSEFSIDAIIRAGGYVVQFRGVVDPKNSIDEAMRKAQEEGRGLRMDRLILAMLANSPIPQWLKPDDVIRLYRVGSPSIDLNRVDDLIVRLYWKIFRNQHPERPVAPW